MRFVFFIIAVVLAQSRLVAQTTDFYVQTTGSNLNAGSTADNAAEHTYTSGSWVASTGIFTVASGDPSTDVAVGDFASVYADGATATGFVGRVTARDATTITVSLSAIHGTAPTNGTNNRTLKIGGAWAGPSGAVGFPFGVVKGTATNALGDPVRVNWKAGQYDVSNAITHNNVGPVFWEGYTTTPGDETGFALIDGGTTGTTYTVLYVQAKNHFFTRFHFRNNGNSGTTSMVDCTESVLWKRCIFSSSYGLAVRNLDSTMFYECEVYDNFEAGGTGNNLGAMRAWYSGSLALRCVVRDNVKFGMQTDGGILLHRTIVTNNGSHGAGSTGDENLFIVNCDFHSNAGHGYALGQGSTSAMNCIYINTNFVDNTEYGIRSGSQGTPGLFLHNGFGSGTQANGSGDIENEQNYLELGTVTLTADTSPYSDAGANNYAITAAGAVGVGYSVWTQIAPGFSGTTGSMSTGAAQQ